MSEPYTLITADTHAQYREYLDPSYREAFDVWRGGYKNPAQEHYGAKKKRNWDLEIRSTDQNGQGVVGEAVFPNTVPPFYKKSIVTTQPPKPEQYEQCLAGIRAHNRWLVDFCAEDPGSAAIRSSSLLWRSDEVASKRRKGGNSTSCRGPISG